PPSPLHLASIRTQPAGHESALSRRRLRPVALHLYSVRRGGDVVAHCFSSGQYPQPVRSHGGGLPLPHHRAAARPDPAADALSGRHRPVPDDPVLHPAVLPLRDLDLHHPERAVSRAGGAAKVTRPWSATPGGILLVVRLTPKGGRDAVEGIEELADG